jgi:hypothetical protein
MICQKSAFFRHDEPKSVLKLSKIYFSNLKKKFLEISMKMEKNGESLPKNNNFIVINRRKIRCELCTL